MKPARMYNNKGSSGFPFVITAVFSLIVIFIGLAIGANILQGTQSTQTANTASYNVSQHGLLLLSNVSTQGNMIGLVVGAGILLVIMVLVFGKVISGIGGGRSM